MKTFLFILAACQCTQQPEPSWLQSLLESGTMPLLTALLLGLLTALSPCPLATNIAAIGYLGRRIDNRRTIFLNGLYYTLGRTLAYTLLAWVLLWGIRTGATALGLEDALRVWGERLLGPVLVVMGVLMFFADRLRLPSLNTSGSERLAKKGAWGALLLGVLFALAFCPSSAMFYFGMLIPLSASTAGGWLLPVVFSIATALPVLIVAWLLAFSVQKVSTFYNKMQSVQKWLTVIVGTLFVAIGIYYIIRIYF